MSITRLVVLASILALAGPARAAPLEVAIEAESAAPVVSPDTPAQPESEALEPVEKEQADAAREHAARKAVEQMLALDFDSRGPTWAENAGIPNAAEHGKPVDENERLAALLREIEAAAKAREESARGWEPPPARPGDAATQQAQAFTNLWLVRLPREIVEWVKNNREQVVAGSVLGLLLVWLASALLPDAPLLLRRKRPSEPAPRRSRRRRRSRLQRPPADGVRLQR